MGTLRTYRFNIFRLISARKKRMRKKRESQQQRRRANFSFRFFCFDAFSSSPHDSDVKERGRKKSRREKRPRDIKTAAQTRRDFERLNDCASRNVSLSFTSHSALHFSPVWRAHTLQHTREHTPYQNPTMKKSREMSRSNYAIFILKEDSFFFFFFFVSQSWL